MRKLVASILILSLLLAGCAGPVAPNTPSDIPAEPPLVEVTTPNSEQPASEEQLNFLSLSDPNLLSYVEDAILAEIEALFSSDDYRVECVTASYVSKEYLDELAYNSKSNVYFGYTLREIEEQFAGTRYIFTLDDEGETVVKAFEAYDDTFDQVIRNVAIGSGTILICVTVSALSGGLGATTISTIFAASAKTGTTFALSSGGFAAVTSGIVAGITSGDVETTVKAAALSGSEGYMWGAITGEIVGGASKAMELYRAAHTVRTPRESELAALEKYTGTEQVAYQNGVEVPPTTQGSTRPDVVRTVDGHLEAIEVKNYNLNSYSSEQRLYDELERQVTARVANLPNGSTQRVVLDVHARDFSDELLTRVVTNIQDRCSSVYPNLPVDLMY